MRENPIDLEKYTPAMKALRHLIDEMLNCEMVISPDEACPKHCFHYCQKSFTNYEHWGNDILKHGDYFDSYHDAVVCCRCGKDKR